MKFFRIFSPRILSFLDIGIIIISAPVYARTLKGAANSIPYGIKIIITTGSVLPLAVLLAISLFCFKGGKRAYIAAMLLSSFMALVAITLAGGGGFILIFLDGVESGVYVYFDAILLSFIIHDWRGVSPSRIYDSAYIYIV
jgi:hypothetical protein